MSAIVVDTSSWVSYFRGRASEAIVDALGAAQVYLSPVVAAELLSARMSARDRAALEDVLGHLPLCACDLGHWFRVGGLRRKMQSHGISVSTPDAHVAQCAIDLNARLLTEDAVFADIAQRLPLKLA